MTSPGGGGQNINLAALWIPVLPDTSKMAPAMEQTGKEMKASLEKGFNSAGSSPEAMGQDYIGKFKHEVSRGLTELEIPFGISKAKEWFDQFGGEVDEKVVNKLKGQATEALRAYGEEHQKLAAIQDQATEAERRLNLARDNGFQKASIMLPLMQEHTRTQTELTAQTQRAAEAQDKLSSVTGKLHEEQGKAATSGQMLAGAMGGLVVVGAGLALKAVEAFADVLKEGLEFGIETTKELAEQTLELGESYEQIGIGIREFSTASGEAFEDLEGRAQKVFGTLDVAGANTGQTFAQLTSLAGEAIPDSLVKHVEELQGRFANLKAQDLGAIFYAFKVPAEETDNVLASLTQSARGAGQGVGDLVNAMKGDASDVLHQAGLNAQQAGAFIADMMKLGTGGRSVLGGLQTVMKEAGKEGMSFGDGMKYAGTRLKELGDTAEGQDYAEKLFGTRRWAVAMQAAQDYVDVVAKGPQAYDSNSAALDTFLQQTETLENKWEGVKHKIEEALMPVGLGAVDLMDKLISGIKSKFEENLPAIKNEVHKIGDSFIENIPAIQEFAANTLDFLAELVNPLKELTYMAAQFALGFGQIFALAHGDMDSFNKIGDLGKKLSDLDDKDLSLPIKKAADAIRGFNTTDDVADLKKKFDDMWDSARGEGADQQSPGATPPNPAASLPAGAMGGPGVAPSIEGQPQAPPGYTVGPQQPFSSDPFAPQNVPGGQAGGSSGIYQDAQGKWHAHDPWWEGVMQAESGGNQAPTGNPTHFGLFQFAQSTWDGIAKNLNPAWVGKNPGTAPAEIQAQFAQQNYTQNKGNLYGQWANPYVQAHPGGTAGNVWEPPVTGNGNGDGDGVWNGSGPGGGPSYPDPTTTVNAAGGLNLQTVAVAAQKFSNDCIDASARIILSHSGVDMTEDQLKGVITPGTNINNLASGLNQLDPQGNFKALAGSGGSPEAMFAAIKASIDSGTGSILNVAPGSSLAGHTFAPGHFIAATGYNGDGTINLSDTAHGTKYSVSEADAYQATAGRGIVSGYGRGPAAVAGPGSPLVWNGSGDGSTAPNGYAGLPGQYGGSGAYGGQTSDEQFSAAKAVQEAQDHAADLDAEIVKQQRSIQDIKDEIAKGDPKAKVGPLGQPIVESPEEQAAAADKTKRLQEQLDDANTALTKLTRERGEQDANISQAQRKAQESSLKSPKGSGQSAEGKEGETLGSGLLAGLGQELGLGDVLGKSPMDWGIVKLAEGLFNYGNGLGDAIFGKSGSLGGSGTPGGMEGLGGGVAQGLLGSLGVKIPNIGAAPNVIPGSAVTGVGSGPLPGPPQPGVVNNDNSITVSPNVDPSAILPPVIGLQRDQNAQTNSQAYQYQGGVPAQ